MITGLSVARTVLREVAGALAITFARWLWPHPSDYEWED